MTPEEQKERALDEAYALIFESNRSGQVIYEDLINRFGHLPAKSQSIDRILDAFEYNGKRKVLEYITTRINRANGVSENVETVEVDYVSE